MTITCVNDAPVAMSDIQTATGTEDTPLLLSVLVNDTDTDNTHDQLSITGLTQVSTGGTLSLSGGTQILYTPTSNFCTPTPLFFTYQTKDIGGAMSASATGSFVVNCVNDAPVAIDDLDGTLRNVSVLLPVLTNDTDTDNTHNQLSITGLTHMVLGTAVLEGTGVRFTPSLGLCGTGSFDYQVEDTNSALSNTASAFITVNCVNDAPVAVSDTQTVLEDASATLIDLIANDTDSD